tara:strand:+ start:11548 stop:11697 length:150 start_codon:yes stop_codon:yes gene_type:complete
MIRELNDIKAKAWDKLLDYFSQNTGTENDTQEDWEMRELMHRILMEVKE